MATRRMRIKAVANVPLGARGRPDRPVTPLSLELPSMPASPLPTQLTSSLSATIITSCPPSPKAYGHGGPFSPTYQRLPPKTPPPHHQPSSPSGFDGSHSSNSHHFRPIPSVSPLPPSASLLQNIRSPSPVKLVHPPSPKRPETPKSLTFLNATSPLGSSFIAEEDSNSNSRSAFSVLSPSPSYSSGNQSSQRLVLSQSANIDAGFLSPRPVPAHSPRPPQAKTPTTTFAYLNINHNSNSADSGCDSVPSLQVTKVEKEDSNKHTFKDKFTNVINRQGHSNNTIGSHLHSASQKNVNNTDTLKQRLQKPSAAYTLTKYQVARKDFLTRLNTQQEAPKRNEMTMLHFAFWNPPKPNVQRRAASICEEKEFYGDSNSNTENSVTMTATVTARRATIGAVPITKEVKKEPKLEEKPKPLGPRVKVGPDGKLILDEKSLVVETSESVRAKKQLAEMKTVSGSEYAIGSGFYRHKKLNKRGSDWTIKETVRFYRALSTCGTDFSMMTSLFPHRTRAELKSKFKREDRRNKAQVDSALSCQEFNPMEGFSSDEEDVLADERPMNGVTVPKKSAKTKREVKSVKPESVFNGDSNSKSTKDLSIQTPTKEGFSNGDIINASDITKNLSEVCIPSDVKNLSKCKKPKKVRQNILSRKDADKEKVKDITSPSKYISDVMTIDIQSTIESISKNVFTGVSDTQSSNDKFKAGDPNKKPRKSKVAPKVPKVRLPKKLSKPKIEPITITDVEVDTRPDILRFDPSDPLGFKVVVPVGGIVIDIRNPDNIIQEDQLIEKLKENQEDPNVLNSDIKQVIGPIKSVERRSRKRKQPFRVPGPGGQPPTKAASLADEFEIEISCN